MSNPKRIMKPIIISPDKKMLLPPQKQTSNVQISKITLPSVNIYKEDVIYESKNCDFLRGDSQEVRIVHRLNLITKTSRTIAKCTSKGVTTQTTSDDVCTLIGQKNYDTVLSALSSIYNEETKVRGILSLLKPQTYYSSISTQADFSNTGVEASIQTEKSMIRYYKEKTRKRRRQISTYVVKDDVRPVTKCVINIADLKKELKVESKDVEPPPSPLPANPLPHLNIDEDSSCSIGSMSSVPSLPGALDRTEELLNAVEKATVKETPLNPTVIKVLDGSLVQIPIKPEDNFHIATPEILKHVTKEERRKLLQYQAYLDSSMCLERDQDGFYPLHLAVLHYETEMVRRQCFALRARRESVDILGTGGMTALHMAIRQNAPAACINSLLFFGADPLLGDADGRTSFHHAADAELTTLNCVLAYCDKHARRLLQYLDDYWKPELDGKSDEELARYLHEKVADTFDEQGYTPLMLAAASAQPSHVHALASRAPALVDVAARGGGDTALHRAVAAACQHTRETNNRFEVPEKYLRTVEILVENGADPGKENNSGTSVNTLLTEYNIAPLSMAIANKMNAKHSKLTNEMILYKPGGTIDYNSLNFISEMKTKLQIPAAEKAPEPKPVTEVPKRGKTMKVKKQTDIQIVKRIGNIRVVHPKPKSPLPKYIVKPNKKLVLKDNFSIKQEANKVIIVENVTMNKVYPTVTVAALKNGAVKNVAANNMAVTNVAANNMAVKNDAAKNVVVKNIAVKNVPIRPKDILISPVPIKTSQKLTFVNIAPKPMNCKKRKLN